MEKFHCILVKDEEEKDVALEAGWDEKDILLPVRVQLEGRRFHTLTITWMALDWLIDTRDQDYLMAILHRQAITMAEKVPVRIDDPSVPPPHEHDWVTYDNRSVCSDPHCHETKGS